MSMSDPLGDMLTRIRNAQRSNHTVCVAPGSRLRANVLDVLKREGYIRGFSSEELRPGVSQLRIELKYNGHQGDHAHLPPRPARLFQDQGAAAGL
jgi:small subunit ribosomal protein S8